MGRRSVRARAVESLPPPSSVGDLANGWIYRQKAGGISMQTALVFALQTAREAARLRFWEGRRFVGVLLIVLLVLGIAVLAKKLTK